MARRVLDSDSEGYWEWAGTDVDVGFLDENIISV